MTVDENRNPRSTGTRGRLVSVARALFAERGFAGTSTTGMDAIHHPSVSTTTVRRWCPPFCAVIDFVLGGFILAWFG